MKRKRSKYRLQGKTLLLTYPQTDIDKQTVMTKALETFQNYGIKWIIVAQENHEDSNGQHIHCAVSLKERFRTRDEHALDVLANKHGNYQSCRSISKTVQYVTKHGDFLSHNIDVQKYLKAVRAKKSTRTALVEQTLMETNSIEAVLTNHPGFTLLHLRKMKEFITYMQENKSLKKRKTWLPLNKPLGIGSDHATIIDWINNNLHKERQFKQKQLYIWGEPNMGKTTMIRYIEQFSKVYYIPKEDFYDLYNDDYDLAVMDEFCGNKSITFWNEWLQGSTMPLRIKGSQGIKRKNIPTIILSNLPLEDCYSNANPMRLEAMKERLTIVQILTFIDLNKFH